MSADSSNTANEKPFSPRLIDLVRIPEKNQLVNLFSGPVIKDNSVKEDEATSSPSAESTAEKPQSESETNWIVKNTPLNLASLPTSSNSNKECSSDTAYLVQIYGISPRKANNEQSLQDQQQQQHQTHMENQTHHHPPNPLPPTPSKGLQISIPGPHSPRSRLIQNPHSVIFFGLSRMMYPCKDLPASEKFFDSLLRDALNFSKTLSNDLNHFDYDCESVKIRIFRAINVEKEDINISYKSCVSPILCLWASNIKELSSSLLSSHFSHVVTEENEVSKIVITDPDGHEIHILSI
jgi:hypothetical protein